MMTMAYFIYPPQSAEDLFSPLAGLNNPGVMASFHTGIARTREHLMAALAAAQPGGNHETLCYHFHVGASLLSSILDGIAVFVEKKVSDPPMDGVVYWDGPRTFLDPRFAELRELQQTSTQRIIMGGISTNTLQNFAKHYLPWTGLSCVGRSGWDIRFPIDANTKSGPVLRGLMFPLYNDVCDAYDALGRLLKIPAPPPVIRL